jgi:hypothetical protein
LAKIFPTDYFIFSLFGYFDESENVLNLKERSIYTEDYLGLKALDKKGRLKLFTVSGVQHISWRKNLSVIDDYIIPFLD